jgi:hypothetical protein
MIVCWLTLHILAASPVVKTVFMVVSAPSCVIKDKVPPSGSLRSRGNEEDNARLASLRCFSTT